MDPVVVGCSFQWFTGINRFVELLLLLPKEIGYLLGVLSLDAITFSLLLCLLLVGYLWWFYKVMLCIFHRAEHALVLLEKLVQSLSLVQRILYN